MTLSGMERFSTCFPNGEPKGMKIILEERGIDTQGMTGSKMREILSAMPDFASQKSLVEEMIERRGHLRFFLPKFHCELNPIERCWCQAKRYTWAHANGTITRLRKIIHESLDTVTFDMMQKFFTTCRDYERAYREAMKQGMWKPQLKPTNCTDAFSILIYNFIHSVMQVWHNMITMGA